ncbi:hypothetical protein FHS72_001556 [Loktanella ponticola]|uniref:Uncharacterized protein n=1 Tax=Yoonia ponticola TaxID=1524255 RepID=A0A7W9BJY3_9RHOB|nr:hypothetical protein [Yoonia ponticola]MBB5721932.1 hypothetical protein [Yoonia ponticola]
MKDIFRILIAPLVWFASFSAVYGLHGLLCGHEVSGVVLGLPLERAYLVAAYVCAIAVQVVLIVALYSSRLASPSPFVRFVSHATGWVGLIATIWSLVPVVFTTYCG